jgi:hypothetical protein
MTAGMVHVTTLTPPGSECNPNPTCALNSSALCASSSTVSAEVMHPLHARQSDSVTFTGPEAVAVGAPRMNADDAGAGGAGGSATPRLRRNTSPA